MLTVVTGGVFSLLALAVKALIDAGSKERRQRAAIAADLELYKALSAAGVDEMATAVLARMAARVSEYTGWIGQFGRRNDAEVALARSERSRRIRVYLILVLVSATAFALLTFVLLLVDPDNPLVKPSTPSDTENRISAGVAAIALLVTIGFTFRREMLRKRAHKARRR